VTSQPPTGEVLSQPANDAGDRRRLGQTRRVVPRLVASGRARFDRASLALRRQDRSPADERNTSTARNAAAEMWISCSPLVHRLNGRARSPRHPLQTTQISLAPTVAATAIGSPAALYIPAIAQTMSGGSLPLLAASVQAISAVPHNESHLWPCYPSTDRHTSPPA